MTKSSFSLSPENIPGNRRAAPQDTQKKVTDLRRHANFHSAFLPQDRDLIVYLPPGYESQPDKRYAVLYLHDGQNLFDPRTAYIPGKDWNADETAERLITDESIDPLILVGIYNTGENRIAEYTPTRDPQRGGGGAALYGRMLVEEIKPFMEQNYRILDGPSHTALGGSSLGGLVTLFIGLHYADVFGKLAVLSPSVWWNHRAILRVICELDPKPEMKIWLDVGTGEGKTALRNTRALRDALIRKGWVSGIDLLYSEIPGAAHDELAWGASVAPMLRFLFPNKRTPML